MKYSTSVIRSFFSALLLSTLLGGQFAYAATASSSAPTPPAYENLSGPTAPVPAGTTDCFQYYHFGSVQADIQSNVSNAVSGAPITFTGTIENSNPYPIVDGGLYVKVFKTDGSGKNVNGPEVVDQFMVRDGIDLPAESSMPIVFTWNIPSYAVSGNYQVATFFTADDQFNLLGLSFTNDVVGNTADFSVNGELTSGVSFNNSSVTVAGQPYHFAAFPPEVSATSSVPVKALITNTTDKEISVPVTWDLYEWDAISQQNLVQHTQAFVNVPANGSAPVTFIATDTSYPVYLLVGSLNWGNTQSVIDVRFVRSGVDRLRLNFPGVSAFPLKAGVPATLFSCLYNSGLSASIPDGKLVLTLSDPTGAIIDQETYQGAVTGTMMGVAYTFTPKQSYDTFDLDAKLYQGTVIVDESTIHYDCSDIASSTCLPASATEGTLLGSFSTVVAIVVLIIIALALLVVGWRLRVALRPRHDAV